MRNEIGTLWAIGAATASHASVARMVSAASALAGQAVEDGSIGPLDVGYVHLCAAAHQLSLLSPESVRSVAGAGAAGALADLMAAVDAARRAYGPTAGPDRTGADAEVFREVLALSAAEAGAAFARYAGAVAGLTKPSVEDWLAAREGQERPEARKRRPQIVPSVRAPRPSEETSAKARAILGEAYGVLGAAYAMRDRNGEDGIGNAARFEVMALSGRIGVQADALAWRCAAADRPFADEVQTCVDAVDNLVGRIEGQGPGGASPPDALRNCAMLLAGRIRRVDAARVALGHAEDDVPAPRP